MNMQEATGSQPSALSQQSKFRTNPYIGILGVFIGATIATMNARLLGVGLPDLRGAMGLSFDEAAWMPTALNMATMFSGCFVVFLSALFGPRRILLPASAVFAVMSALLPLVHGYPWTLALTVLAGLTSGTFYSLTMTFVLTALPKRLILFGIAAYAADIVFTGNIATALEGWFLDHLSWRWIFWGAAITTPLMTLCIYFGIPKGALPAQRPSWRGFLYFSLGLSAIYGALDQGERLDWLNSGVVVALLAAGLFLLVTSYCRRLIQPNPILNLSFLFKRNIIVLALSVFIFKFVQLSAIVLVPNFLGSVLQYRPLQIGAALAWVAVPMFVTVWVVVAVVFYTNSRLTLAFGLAIAAVTCWRYAHVDSSWAGVSFELWELVLAAGFACSYVGLVSSLVLEAIEGGAMTSPNRAATFSGFIHFIRLFGGEVGVAFMTHFISTREKFHSNSIGLHVQRGNWISEERLHMLAGGLLRQSVGQDQAQYRAAGILGQQVRAQAYTMAIADGFILIAWMVVAYLLMMLILRPAAVSFKDLRRLS